MSRFILYTYENGWDDIGGSHDLWFFQVVLRPTPNICFFFFLFVSSSKFEVVIYNFKLLYPPMKRNWIFKKYRMNTSSPRKASPFICLSAHICAFWGVSDLREGSVEKTQSPDASTFCYILRRIIIRRCKA